MSVAQTDAAGNPQEAAPNTATFAVDTIAPAAPVLALGSGVGDGATDAESAAAGGVITVTGENGAAIVVTLTGQSDSVVKTVTGTGSAVAVPLTAGDVDTLGEGEVSVSATQTDEAGNAQTVAAATTTLTIDTVAPSAPTVALGTGVPNGATDAEAAASGGVITVTGEAGASIEAAFIGTTGAGNSFTKEITATGSADAISLTAAEVDALGEGGVTVAVTQTDAAGNTQAAQPAEITFSIDTVAPAVPSFVLHKDSGTSDPDYIDNITSDLTIDVTLAIDMASWEYSLDAGINWSTGTGTSFELVADKTYAAGDIQVRQSDAAGNVSAAKSNSAEIQTLSPIAPPTFALHADTGSSDTDNVTKDATVDVALLTEAIGWSYSLDAGANWQTGAGASFELASDATYVAGDIQVVQRGLDGTDSSPTLNTAAITTDNTPLGAPSAITLQLDSGTSSSDGKTNDATVNVSLGSDAQLAGWEYSTDGGVSWVTGFGTSFELSSDTTYAADKIQARLVDTAGNKGAVAKISSEVITDMVGDAPVTTTIANSKTIDVDYLYALKTLGDDEFAAGTTEANASVRVLLTENIVVETTADDAGAWSVNAQDFGVSIDADNKITLGTAVGDGTTTVILADDQSYTLGVEIRDVAGNTSAIANTTYTVNTPGIVVSESNNVITISGTATGKLMVDVDASGNATLSRLNDSGETFTTTTTVSNFYDKQLKGTDSGTPSYTKISDVEITVDGGELVTEAILKPGQSPVEAYYVIVDVPEAESITIKGDLGSHSQPNVVVVRVADDTLYATDTIDLLVDTSGLANKKTSDVFELEALQTARNDKSGAEDDSQGASGVDSDVIRLDVNTDVSGFNNYYIQNGSVEWFRYVSDGLGGTVRKMFIDDTDAAEAFSTVGITLSQLMAAASYVNILDSGTLNVKITSDEQSDLEAFLVSPGSLKLVGYDVKALIDTVTIISTDPFEVSVTTAEATLSAAAQAGLEAISFDGFVNTKAAIETLSAEVKGSGWDAANYKTLSDISAQLDILKGAVDVSGSILNQIGTWPTYDATSNTHGTDGSGLYQQVADHIDASIANLEDDLKDGVSNSFDTLKEIETFVTNLKALVGDADGALGNGETTVTARLDAIEASLANFIIDKTGPTVESVAITSAAGIERRHPRRGRHCHHYGDVLGASCG